MDKVEMDKVEMDKVEMDKVEMDKVEIIFKKQIANSPCMAMMLQAHAELIEKSWAMNILPFGHKSSCIYAQIENDIAGAIVFIFDPDIEVVHTQLSYVKPQYRGRRIYQSMHKYLHDYARKVGAHRITSTVHIDNQPLLQASTRSGMTTRWVAQILEL